MSDPTPVKAAPVVETHRLFKEYSVPGKPAREVVKGVDFKIWPGKSFGLMGLTGAGKSTLIGMMAGLIVPTHGEVIFEGEPASPGRLRDSVMLALGNDLGFYKGISILDNLVFFGAMFGLDRKEALERAKEVVEIVWLRPQKDTRYGSLSSGQKRQAHLARALLIQRPLLIVDEPTRGLDPTTEQRIVDVLVKIKKTKQTMLVVTHDVHLAATICDHVGILDQGQIIRHGTVEELTHILAADRIYIRFHDDPAEVIKRLELLEHLTELHHHDREVHVYTHDPESDINDVVRIIVESNLQIAHIDLPEATLEEVFLKVIAERRHEAKQAAEQSAANAEAARTPAVETAAAKPPAARA